MRQPSTTRRRLLRHGGTALGAAAFATLAGCSGTGLLPGGGTSLPAYATWLPAPGRVFLDPGDADDPATRTLRRYYPFRVTSYDDVVAYLEETGTDAAGPMEATGGDYETGYEDGHVHPVLDVGPADAGLAVRSTRGLSVLETDLDDPEIVGAFASYGGTPEPFERAGEYGGYVLLTVPGGSWTAGVRDGVVVEGFVASGFGGPLLRGTRAAVEALIDARGGEGRYVAADGALREVVTRLGAGTFVNGSTYGGVDDGDEGGNAAADGPAASGTALTVDGEATTARHVAVFGSAASASVDHLDEDRFADWEDVAVSTDGRIVVVEGTLRSGTVI